MSGNLPPGVSASDIDDAYGPSVEPHDHDFVPIERQYPIVEDGAAIFREECDFVEITDSYTDDKRDETYYETGAECEATRSFRFELAYVKFLNEDGLDLTFSRSVLDFFEDEDQDLWEAVMEEEYRLARAYNRNDDDVEVVTMDDEKDGGSFVIRGFGIEVGYGPGVMEEEE